MNRYLTTAALTVCTLAATTSSAEASAYTSTDGRGRYTASASVNVRSIPSTRGRIVSRLYRGKEVYVYGISGSWARIYVSGKRSFVSRFFLRKKTTTTTTPARPSTPSTPSSHPARTTRAGAGSYVARTTVNVRTGPSTSYARVGALKTGERVTVYGIASSWARFSFRGATRYVHADYIRRATTSSPPPTARPTPPRPRTDTRARTTTAGAGTYEATTSAGTVRFNPVSTSGKAGSLTRGRRYTVRGIGDSYARISFGGATRYTHKAFLRKVTPPPPHPATTTTAGRGNHLVIGSPVVRADPRTTARSLGLRRGGTVYVQGKARGWARVSHDGRRGFLATTSLTSIVDAPGAAHSWRYEVTSVSSVLRTTPTFNGRLEGRLARGATFTAMRKSGSYIGFNHGGRLRWAFQGTVKPIPNSTSGQRVTRAHYKPRAITYLRMSPAGSRTSIRVGTGSSVYSVRETSSWMLVEFLGRTAGWISKSRVERAVDTSRPAYTARRSRTNTWDRGNSDFAVGVDGSASIDHDRDGAGGSGSMRAFVKVFGKKVTIARLRSNVRGDLRRNFRRLTHDGIRVISILGDSPFSHGNTFAVSYSILEEVFGVKPEFRVPLLGIPIRVAFDAAVDLSLASERRPTGGGWNTSSSLTLGAGISGEIGVDVFVGGAGVGGEVKVTTGPSIDFTLRPTGAEVDLGVGASVGGRVYLYGRIGKGFLSYTEDVTILSYTLASTRATLVETSVMGN